MKTILLLALGLIVVVGVGVYVWNASWRASPPENPQVRIIAHRGVHQDFDMTNVGNDTCTATRVRAPVNPVMENTLASMRAAIDVCCPTDECATGTACCEPESIAPVFATIQIQ